MLRFRYPFLRFVRGSVSPVARPAQKKKIRYQSTQALPTATIEQLTQGKKGVKILWSDQKVTSLPYSYLLDNNPNVARSQRQLSSSQREILPVDLVISRDSDELTIRWDNGDDSFFPNGWLASRRQGIHKYSSLFSEERKYHDWDAQTIQKAPKFEFDRLQRDDQLLLEMLQQLQSRGFALVVNAGRERETAEKFAHLLDTVPRPNHYKCVRVCGCPNSS